jgi:hypothetical protein
MLNQVIEELRDYLQNWYDAEIKGKKDIKAKLGDKFIEFFQLHPEWASYRRNILACWHRSQKEMSLSDCREITDGVVVSEIDLKRAAELALYTPKDSIGSYWIRNTGDVQHRF